MKGSLKVWLVILGILVVGSATTFFTYSYVADQREKMTITADKGHSNAEYYRMLTETQAPDYAEEEIDAGSGTEEAVLEDIAADKKVLEEKAKMDDETADAKSAKNLEAAEEEILDLQAQLAKYQRRLPELDRQIEQMRNSEVDGFVYSVKNAAQTERRIWERELEGIYRLLLEFLDEQSVQELKKEQEKWEKLRDSRAQEAGKKNSGGSMESVDYIASVAASARERAYQLLEKYQE